MEEERQVAGDAQIELGGEDGLLVRRRREIPVVVEATLADGHDNVAIVVDQLAEPGNDRAERRSVPGRLVRMAPDRAIQARAAAGARERATQPDRVLRFGQRRPRDNDVRDARLRRPLQKVCRVLQLGARQVRPDIDQGRRQRRRHRPPRCRRHRDAL